MSSNMFLSDNSVNNYGAGTLKRGGNMAYPGALVNVVGDVGG